MVIVQNIKNITKKDLKDLAKEKKENNITLSLYLDARIKGNVRHDFVSAANSLISENIRKIKNGTGYSVQQKKKIIALTTDLKNKMRFVKVPPDTKSVAMFFNSANGQKIFHLPRSVEPLMMVGDSPYIRPLAKIVEKFPRYLVCAVDRNKVSFMSVFLGEIEKELETFSTDVPQRLHAARTEWLDLNKSRVVRHIEDHLNIHLKKVAAKIKDYFRENKFDYLVVGSHGELVIKLTNILDKRSGQKLIGTFLLTHHNSRSIESKSVDIVRTHEKELERKLLENLFNGVNNRTWPAIIGIDSVLENLNMHSASSVVVGRNYKRSGYICPKCGYFFSVAKYCSKCAERTEKVFDLIDEIIKAAIGGKMEVKLLMYPHKEFDKYGIGAFLK